ncbi:unnamed protein product [Rotaria magnacalcarata]|uniref:Uncharacterized protein n=1 Tax=Rotaria magnacalcarata TaxID=392030 RepID=A0A8S3JKZ6_9BILA|nr:unnamed protein product [Rotaria magnacalcarata]
MIDKNQFYLSKIGRQGYGGGYGQAHGAGGGMMNQLEKVTHMDLNGDGRVGGAGYGHAPPPNQYGPPGYPPQYNQYGGAPCPPNYGAYGGPGYPPNYNQYGGGYPPPPMNQYGAPGYASAPYQGGGGGGGMGGGLINQLEKVTHMDLNGDGRVGGSGYRPPHNQYGPPY